MPADQPENHEDEGEDADVQEDNERNNLGMTGANERQRITDTYFS